ncbi:hypothetical protein ACTWQF_03505 [Streptomyces sp. 8N114]|uniref:hypothetical protein n=1 Tax=Streptomyces sp. 8N114 TaxID=3457419 RepID=UPI003FD5C799
MRNKPARSVIFAVSGTAALVLSLTACGSDDSGVDKAAVAKALDKDTKKVLGGKTGMSEEKWDKLIDCSADVMVENGDPEDLQAFVDGKKKAKDVKPKEGKTKADINKAGEKCG